jgi:peptidoglycan/xylan/chitin deacetylase (PgdA/CDA1 family)
VARRLLLLVPVALAALAVAILGLREIARSRTFQAFGRLVASAQTQRRVVALTFDDGPTSEAIDEVLGVLESRHVHGTFFVNGIHLARAPGLGRRLVAAGHELGNHTYSHDRMVLRSQAFIRSEVERTDELIRSAGGSGEIYFRAPFCWKLLGLPWYLWRTGRTSVTWDVEPDSPPSGTDPVRIVEACRRAVHPGAIILLHVWYRGREPSRLALPVIIEKLRADGYELVTVRELLQSARESGAAE